MSRYQVHKDGRPFIDRLRLIQVPWFAVYLTRIHAPDTDRAPHDHSRSFWTFILSGSYEERVWPCPDHPGTLLEEGVMRSHARWSRKYIPRTWAHQITEVRNPLITLVIAGRRAETWHFWEPDGPVDWREHE
jgi:hypothetical protein